MLGGAHRVQRFRLHPQGYALTEAQIVQLLDASGDTVPTLTHVSGANISAFNAIVRGTLIVRG